MPKLTLDQINLISGDLDASLTFYRTLGVQIPDANVWRTSTGAHHANGVASTAEETAQLDLDSCAFAQKWNSGWKGRDDLSGGSDRVVFSEEFFHQGLIHHGHVTVI